MHRPCPRPRSRAAQRALFLSLTLIWFAPLQLSAQNDSLPHPTLEDLFTVAGLGGIALSPDGRFALYTVTTTDLDSNKTDSEIWLVATEGGDAPTQLTFNPGSDATPLWRPDGSAFAFLSARGTGGDSRPALYLMGAFGGEARELYSHATSINGFAWSDDGQYIAFTASDEESSATKDNKKQGRDIEVEDEPVQYRHLWLLNVDNGEARRLTEGNGFTVGSFAWQPGGRHLAFSATPSSLPLDSWKSDIYLIDALTDSTSPRRLTTNPGPDANPVWTPDGDWIVFSGRQTSEVRLGYNRVFRMRVEGGEVEDISPNTDVNPSGYVFAPDGRSVVFQATTGTTRAIFSMSLDERQPVRLTPDAGVYGGASFSQDHQTVAFQFESPEHPREVYVASLASRPRQEALAEARKLTSHNQHAEPWAVGTTEVIRWASSDGREIEGLVVLPAGWSEGDAPHALIAKIHGGPSGVHVQSFQASSSSADAQRYAADGYAVFLPNPRGSSGYGDASQRSVIEDWGGLDFQDIMTGIDYLVERGVAHPDSLGVMGWSYGGFMTAWTVTQTNRFKAAVAGAAITENISMWGTQDILHVFEAYFGGGPYQPGRWDVYQRSNPLAFVTQATTPTMIIHGKNDPRVPPNQARTFFRALRANDVATKLVWLPRTGHGPREPGLRYETARHQKEWLDQWIRLGGGSVTFDE